VEKHDRNGRKQAAHYLQKSVLNNTINLKKYKLCKKRAVVSHSLLFYTQDVVCNQHSLLFATKHSAVCNTKSIYYLFSHIFAAQQGFGAK